MPSNFKNFRSTVTPPGTRPLKSTDMLLTDPNTGAPVGIQNQSANGPDGMWTPIDLTAAQIASPTAAMIADLNSTFRLNVAPYTRYQSDGTTLAAIGAETTETIIPPGLNDLIYSPLTVAAPQTFVVQGQERVIAYPA